ncbi:MAG: hypothetical protein GWP56_12895 [Gammaproteobacteria bacterium]|jgi:hypothetical protein|nr:hypothetical protein [Gammaproteobacteria bacterium]
MSNFFSLTRMTIGFLIGAVITWMVYSAALAAASEKQSVAGDPVEVVVEFDDGLLTLRAVNAPLDEVIAEIGAKAGFTTTVYGNFESRLDRSFDSAPLERALRDLLVGVSNIIWFDETPERKIMEIFLFGNTGSGSVSVKPDSPPAPATVIDRRLDRAQAEEITRSAERAGSGDAGAIAELANMLRTDPDAAVRGAAAVALGEIGSAEAAVILQSGVRDDNQMVRIRSIRALALISNDQSTQILADLLFNHPDTRTRLLAAWALGRQGSALAQTYLETARQDRDELVRKAVERARTEAANVEP